MIFESTQDLLHKFKHSAFLNKKEKEKHTGHAAGPLGFGPSRPERSAHADAARAAPSLRGH